MIVAANVEISETPMPLRMSFNVGFDPTVPVKKAPSEHGRRVKIYARLANQSA